MAATTADKIAYLQANADAIARLIPGGMSITREAASGSIVSVGLLAYGGSPMTPTDAVANSTLSPYLPQ